MDEKIFRGYFSVDVDSEGWTYSVHYVLSTSPYVIYVFVDIIIQAYEVGKEEYEGLIFTPLNHILSLKVLNKWACEMDYKADHEPGYPFIRHENRIAACFSSHGALIGVIK